MTVMIAKAVGETGANNAADIMTPRNLPDLLKIIQRRNLWGLNLELKLFVVLKGKVVTTSVPQLLACPVRPHNVVNQPAHHATGPRAFRTQLM